MYINTDHFNFQKNMALGETFCERDMSKKIKVLGICLGASTVSMVQLDQDQISGKGKCALGADTG